MNIVSKNFYFIFLREQFLLINFNCDKYFNHLKSKRIPPPINLLLGKQSSNSTIFALKISLNRYKKQRRIQLTGTIEVPFDPNQRPNTLTSVTYLLVCFSSSSVRYNSMETLQKSGDILKKIIVSNFTCAKLIPKQRLLCKIVAYIISRKIVI